MSTAKGIQNESEVRSMRGGDDHPEPDNMMTDRYQALQQNLLRRISSSIDSIRVDCLGVFTAAARRHPHVDHDSYVWAIDALNDVTDIYGLWDWLCEINIMISGGAERLNSYWFLLGYIREGGELVEKHADEFAGFLLSVQEVEILRSGSWSIDRWGRIHADSSRRTERQRSHVLW